MSRKVLIICGHGAGDSGATGGGKTEAALVRKLGNKIRIYGGANFKLMNTKKNYYEEGFSEIQKKYNPKKWRIIELHMDSGSKNANGGHVIVNSSYKTYGRVIRKVRNVIVKHFPGRLQTIVKRSDLANPKRAKSLGFLYMLVECGFISNKRDREYFIANLDKIAKDIIKACGHKVVKQQ